LFLTIEWWLPGAGEGNEDLMFNGYRVSVFPDDMLWRLVAQQCEYTLQVV
jgi:hypothetical protein